MPNVRHALGCLSALLILNLSAGIATAQDGTSSAATASPMVENDVPYADGGDQQKLDLYLPTRTGFTTIVFTYGGGWRSGSRKSVGPIAETLQALGFGCALLSHRLLPDHTLSAQASDVAAGFAWVKNNIEARGGNSANVFLMGHSSGAHLSLLVASDPRYLRQFDRAPSDIRGVVGLSTPVDLEPQPDKKGYGDVLLAGRGAALFRDVSLMTEASPIQHVSHTLPPALLIVGEHDFPMLADDARRFAGRARAVRADVETVIAPGRDHMGVVRSLLDDTGGVLEQVVAFVTRLQWASP